MEVFAGIHPRVIIFIFGALFALPATALMAFLLWRGQNWARFLPLPFIVAGGFYGNHVVNPAIQNSASSSTFCSQMTELAQSRTQQHRGATVDEVTTISAIRADCAAKLLIFEYKVAVSATSLSQSDMDLLQNDVDQSCKDENSAPLFKAGWEVQKQYVMSDELTLRFKAKC